MKTILLLVIALHFPFTGNNQLHIIVHDDFSDDRNGWTTGNYDDHSVNIQDGKLVITKREAKGRVITISRFLQEDKDFSMEATFTHTEQSENKSVGLVWGHSSETSLDNYFSFSNDGYYLIATDQPSRKEIGEWTKTTFIKPHGQENTLKVVQRTGRLYFYINNNLVKEIKTLKWFDNRFGVITFSNQKLLVDNFILKSSQQINLPPTLSSGLIKENLGTTVNSVYDDLGPIVSADGKTLYFSRKYCRENIGGVEDREDLWYSVSSDGEVWSASRNMGRNINTTAADNLASVSADNNTLMFAVGNGDYAFVHRSANGWSKPERLYLDVDNEADFREAWLSSDGQAILFTAKLKGNLYYQKENGERDIFVCTKKKNGKWNKPVNLGSLINSGEDESSPFLAADGRTLYFATEGRPGYGDADIFVSKRINDSWTDWTEPQNLGPEINTSDFDAYYTVPASGKYAYMVSSSKSLGKTDIIRVSLPETMKPDPVALVSGKILNAKTNKPVSASILFEDLNSDKHAGEAMSDPSTGDYRIILPYGNNYGFHASAKGYISVNENLELVEIDTYKEIQKNLYLVPIEVGQRLSLNNVFFEQGRPLLKAESFPELDRLVDIMKSNPSMEISLEGHTDNVGHVNSLIVLSQDRVSTVKNYLVKNGITASRITGKGYGSSKPLERNDTEEHRRKNRRVEFRIVKI
jgi:outer membrane protein OmpA-like peptidoglycan-associated protein